MNDPSIHQITLPVTLLLAGRPCLTVGGGKVAFRKIGHLLDAGAQVTVVSPELCGETAALVSAGQIRHIARTFEPADVEGSMLVFAATNDRQVNRRVLEACRERHILCSCVDGNWEQSDFTTPAISRHDSLTLAVSTGGQSCRQSKMVKNSLARHLDLVETADLVVVGTDHRHLDLEAREPFHLTGLRLERTGWMIMQLWGVHEFMILNTCNRVELIAVASRETGSNGILPHMLGFGSLKENQFYLKHGTEAYEHLCMVSAGMLSQTPGEGHIAAQIKEALADAQRRGWAGGMMQEWVSSLLHVSKRIKNETAPLLRHEEIEDLALSYLQTQVPDLTSKTVLVMGAGAIGTGLVQEAFPKVGKIIWCYHFNRPEVSEHWKNIELCTFNAIKDRLGEANIIISVVDAPGHVLHSGHAPFFDQEKTVHLIDLGMPRNIDPVLSGISSGIRLIDLDGLKRWHRREAAELEAVFTLCRRIIGEHREQYDRIVKSFQG